MLASVHIPGERTKEITTVCVCNDTQALSACEDAERIDYVLPRHMNLH